MFATNRFRECQAESQESQGDGQAYPEVIDRVRQKPGNETGATATSRAPVLKVSGIEIRGLRMMKHKTTAIVVGLFLSIFLSIGAMGSAWAQDFQKGVEAAQEGDFATALGEWRPLAEQGDAPAQTALGFMYDKGEGVPQDKVMAHMWFNLASSYGSQQAVKSRDRLEEEMAEKEVAEAQKLARECVAKNYKGCPRGHRAQGQRGHQVRRTSHAV